MSSHLAKRVMALHVLLLLCGAVAMSSGSRLSEAEKRGRHLYLRGESLSGRPVKVVMGNDTLEVPAATLPCAGCHGATGKGNPEGGVIPSRITWSSLTKTYGHRHDDGRAHMAFDELSLERAIVEGVDPAGNRLSAVMPKYQMSPADMRDLIAYLKRIETDLAPGLDENTITVATLLPANQQSEISASVRAVLAACFAEVNRTGGIHHRQIVLRVVTTEQAPALLADESVFALVGAMTAGVEQEIATLVQQNETPLIGPFTSLPQKTSPPQRYTFYLFGGLAEQAQVLMKFAARQLTSKPTRIGMLTVKNNRVGEFTSDLLAQGKQDGWPETTVFSYQPNRLQAVELINRLRLEKIEALLFLGASGDAKSLLEEATRQNYPLRLFAPGALMDGETLTALPNFRHKVFLAYPTLHTDQTPAAINEFRALLAQHNIAARHTAAQLSSYVAAKLLIEGLKRAGRELTREKLIQALEGLYSFETGLTPRLTFTPNRRIGAAGAHVIAFDSTAQQFIAVSEWINLNQ